MNKISCLPHVYKHLIQVFSQNINYSLMIRIIWYSTVVEDDDDNVLVSNVRLQEVEDFPIDILLQQSVDVEK
jgi:hypothetical protein